MGSTVKDFLTILAVIRNRKFHASLHVIHIDHSGRSLRGRDAPRACSSILRYWTKKRPAIFSPAFYFFEESDFEYRSFSLFTPPASHSSIFRLSSYALLLTPSILPPYPSCNRKPFQERGKTSGALSPITRSSCTRACGGRRRSVG